MSPALTTSRSSRLNVLSVLVVPAWIALDFTCGGLICLLLSAACEIPGVLKSLICSLKSWSWPYAKRPFIYKGMGGQKNKRGHGRGWRFKCFLCHLLDVRPRQVGYPHLSESCPDHLLLSLLKMAIVKACSSCGIRFSHLLFFILLVRGMEPRLLLGKHCTAHSSPASPRPPPRVFTRQMHVAG